MLKKTIIAVVVIAILGGVGLFILDRTIFAPAAVTTAVPVAPTIAVPTTAPAQPTDPSATAQAGAQPTDPPATAPAGAQSTIDPPAQSGGAGTVYRIDPTQSEAHYEVAETFFQGNRLNLAIGRTKGIAGEVLVDFANPAKSEIGTIVIDVSQLTSDENRRDNFIRHNALQSSEFPQATFKPTKIEGLPASVKPGDQITLKVTGDLTVKQTTKPVTFDVTLTVAQDKLTGTATTEILLSDFGVGPIQIAILQTEDTAKLAFDFVALPAQ